MRKIVVTGGGGFIGSAIVRRLIAAGDQVTVTGRSTYPQLSKLGVNCLQGDIGDQRFMDRACVGADLVFHVAAKAGIWGLWQEYVWTNVHGTATVIRSCRKNGVPALVYTSTPSVVFDRQDLQGVDERVPYAKRTLCHYATSKIIAEKLILKANSPELLTTAIRPHLVWGPGDPHLLPRLLKRGRLRQLKVIGNGQNRVDIAYIDNVVQAHLLVANNLQGVATAAGRPFFIGDRKPVVLWDWLNDLFVASGIAPVDKRVPFVFAYIMGGLFEAAHNALHLAGEPKMTRFIALQLARSHWFSHQAAAAVFNYQPVVQAAEGVERYLSSIR